MARWTLQYPNEIVNGPQFIIKAEHLVDNFNLMESDVLDHLSKVLTTQQTVVGPVDFQGLVTITAGFANVPTVPSNPTSANQLANKAYVDAKAGATGHASAVPKWISDNTFTLATIQESNNSGLVAKATPTTVDITTNGLNGLDTGSVAPDTFYYIYAIAQPTTFSNPGLILSTTNEHASGTIVVPAGYSGGPKIQMPFCVRTQSGSAIQQFKVTTGWPVAPYILYTGTNSIISGGTAGSYTTLSTFTPPIAQIGDFIATASCLPGMTTTSKVRDGSGLVEYVIGRVDASAVISIRAIMYTPNQTIQYLNGAGGDSVTISQVGYVITEIP